MLSNTITARPRPAAQLRRSTSRTSAQGASPPPPYASSLAFSGRKPGVVPSPNYLGSPLPATLQMVGLGNSQPASPHETEQDSNNDWLNEKSREELTELLLKADGLIKERETELGVTSAACKSLYDSNVSLKNQHQALVARIPSSARDSPSPSPISLSDALETSSASPDASTSFDEDPFVYFKRARRISIHPSDISALADQNAELLQKLETLETEALHTDRSGRRALKQLEKEIQQLRDELEDTQARSEQLEKQAQMGTEKIVEEVLKKKKEQEAKVRAMRNNFTPGDAWPFSDETDIRDFAPSGAFSKAYLTPSQSVEFPSSSSYQQFGHPSYGPEHAEHPNQHTLVSQLLAKIEELEETNAQIIEQQSETTDKLQAVQRETESISKVYEYFSPENGIEWEVVAEDGRKSAVEGTIRFRSFRRTLESQNDHVPSLLLPQKAPRRKSVLDLFNTDERQGANRTSTPYPDTSSYSGGGLSPLRLDTSEYGGSPYVGSHQTLQAELGSDFNNDAFDPLLSRQGSLYDLSFSVSPSPTPGSRSPPHSIADSVALRNHSTPVHNALRLSVEPPTPPTGNASGSMRENTKDRHERMARTLSLRTDRWGDGSTRSSFVNDSDSTPTRNSASLPRRLPTALDGDYGSTTSPLLVNETSVVLDDGGRKRRALSAFVLELWLWLQFALVIVVFLWAMAKRGPRSVLSEGDRRAVARRR